MNPQNNTSPTRKNQAHTIHRNLRSQNFDRMTNLKTTISAKPPNFDKPNLNTNTLSAPNFDYNAPTTTPPTYNMSKILDLTPPSTLSPPSPNFDKSTTLKRNLNTPH
jgi:hypothetical protein